MVLLRARIYKMSMDKTKRIPSAKHSSLSRLMPFLATNYSIGNTQLLN